MQKVWLECEIINSSAITEINNQIRSINNPPNVSFSSLPPSIQSCSGFTAEQWMLWTNYYSLFCLYELISFDDLRCWHTLYWLQKCYQSNQYQMMMCPLEMASYFTFFDIALYSEVSVTPNMPMHCHISDCIKDFGPLTSFWLFLFERYNRFSADQQSIYRTSVDETFHGRQCSYSATFNPAQLYIRGNGRIETCSC